MEKIKQSMQKLNQVIYGQEEIVELIFVALLAKGHVLLESVPGTGKTKLAKSFATIMKGNYSRIQFTPDVLPSDITGIRFLNPKTQEFELRLGPVVTNVLLADEINRATPKTQSSLLEVMEETQTTIDGERIVIPSPFIVLATQNPIESNYGTFPLPEAQLDRFLFKVSLDYPTNEEAKSILTNYRLADPSESLSEIVTTDDIISLQEETKKVNVSDLVMDYLIDLVEATRASQEIELGISPRGMLGLMRAAQAKALLNDRDFVTPNDVQSLARYVFEHRIILSMEASLKRTPKDVMNDVISQVPVPVEVGV
ncbi:AAA family ATPase [Oceanobacillus sp. CAU 1775]